MSEAAASCITETAFQEYEGWLYADCTTPSTKLVLHPTKMSALSLCMVPQWKMRTLSGILLPPSIVGHILGVPILVSPHGDCQLICRA